VRVCEPFPRCGFRTDGGSPNGGVFESDTDRSDNFVSLIQSMGRTVNAVQPVIFVVG